MDVAAQAIEGPERDTAAVDVRLTQKDYRRAHQQNRLLLLGARWPQAAFAALGFVYVGIAHMIPRGPVFIAVYAALVLALLGYALWQMVLLPDKRYRAHAPIPPCRYVAGAEGITYGNETYTTAVPWAEVNGMYQTRDFYFLGLQGKLYTLPKRCFAEGADRAAFEGIIRAHTEE